MVLIRTLLLCAVVAVAACIPRAPIPQAPTRIPVAVVAVLGSVEDRSVQAAPEALTRRLVQSVEARNLVAVPDAPAGLLDAFADRRATAQRLGWLVEHHPTPELYLLVEAEARYYSQLEGRYRWTVEVHSALAPRQNLDGALSSQIEVPVFLQFHHEREAAALEAAAPVIQRQVEALLDGAVGGMSP